MTLTSRNVLMVFFVAVTTCLFSTEKKQIVAYPISPVAFTNVEITDAFWGQRLRASKEITIPLAFSKCEETGRYENFVKAAHPSEDYKVEGFSFDDTDVYKTIEGASYLMQNYPDKKMDKYIDSILTIVAAAQEPDGYLYTSRTMNPNHPHEWAGNKRWVKEEDLSHELYNLGHMIEAAVAHYQATGKRNFLDIGIKYADCAVREIGENPNQIMVVPGHQIAEMALAKLYVLTGEKKYLDLAKLFLDKRGKTERRDAYSQAHKPVIEQDEAVGHAVRAAYMYTGMADVAALTGDKSYITAIDKIWDNIVNKKIYITGGIGATSHGEAFGANYELPNMSAYCETCAAIGNVYLNYRLFLLHGDSKYYDVLERTLYNGLISGVSLDGGSFFYPNPLESNGQHQRQAWFGCACCPSNICRFIPSVPGYIYAVHENDVYVNLYMSNNSKINVNNKDIELSQTTNYPWKGDVRLQINSKQKQRFNLKLRIPGWVRGSVIPGDLYRYSDNKNLNFSISVNGIQVNSSIENGYFSINRTWKKGDVVEVHFDMIARTVKANPQVEADRAKVAVECGPLLYCAEWPDNDFDIFSVLLNAKPKFKINYNADLLYGINEIRTSAQCLSFNAEGQLAVKDVELKLIPYYAWSHRGNGKMSVWLANDLSSARPTPAPTLSSGCKIGGSQLGAAVSAINDGLIPKDENDKSITYFHWWPKQNTTEWLSYEFESAKTIKSARVYWYDDAPWGGCRVPQSWKLYYKTTTGEWLEVEDHTAYGIEKGVGNYVKFKSIGTTALKLEVQLPENNSTGIFEWQIE